MAQQPAARLDLEVFREIEAFIYYESRLLDERRFEEWAALYTDDAVYWVPAAPDQTSPIDSVSIIYDDKPSMEVRVRRLRHPDAHAQVPPSRTSHMAGHIMVDALDEQAREYSVTSQFQMLEYRAGRQRAFGGTSDHRLRRVKGGLMVASKTVRLINCDAAFRGIAILF